YAAFDDRDGAVKFEQRRSALHAAVSRVRTARDLAGLPANDLTRSELADELRARGAFRADVTGAGPTVYGLFPERDVAERARTKIGDLGRTWLTTPAWYV